MAYANDWSSAAPADHTKIKNLPAAICRAFIDIEERIAATIYGFTAGETDSDIGFKKIPLKIQGSSPAAVADYVHLFVKEVGGKAELFMLDEDNHEIQLFSAGQMRSGVIYAAAAPSSPYTGMQWYDSTRNVLKIYSGSAWVRLGPHAGFAQWFPGPAANVPAGWILAYGQNILRASPYDELFAAFGTTHGSGDGSTTFGVVDMRGRVPGGLDNMGGSSANVITHAQADVDGGAMGEEEHTQTIDELAPHPHDVNTDTTGSGAVRVARVSGGNNNATADDAASTTGGGQPFNVTQPTRFGNWCVKL